MKNADLNPFIDEDTRQWLKSLDEKERKLVEELVNNCNKLRKQGMPEETVLALINVAFETARKKM